MIRICKKCGKKKEIEEFAKEKKCKDGYQWTCIICKRAKKKEYYARSISINEVKNRAKQKEYRARPETKARRKNYMARPEIKTKNKEYQARPEIKAKRKKHQIKYVKTLPDSYIRNQLKVAYKKCENITPEMIELKRELIIFYRLQKELTDGINSR